MPDVDAVGDPAEIGDRRGPSTRAAATCGLRAPRSPRRARGDEQRAAVGVAASRARARAERGAPQTTTAAPARNSAALARRTAAESRVPRQHDRHERSGERPEDARVRPHVRAVGPRGRPERLQPPGRRGETGEREHADGDEPRPGRAHRQGDGEQHDRPDEVELLLDRERPQVLQRAAAGGREVVLEAMKCQFAT